MWVMWQGSAICWGIRLGRSSGALHWAPTVLQSNGVRGKRPQDWTLVRARNRQAVCPYKWVS